MSSMSDIIGSLIFVISLYLILCAMLSCGDFREFVVLFTLAYLLLAILDMKRVIRKTRISS